MHETSWWWEQLPYPSKGKAISIIEASMHTSLSKILSEGSAVVKASQGFFIFQKNGKNHILSGKLVRIEDRYFKLLTDYLKKKNGKISFGAKQAFESEDMLVITDFLVHNLHGPE